MRLEDSVAVVTGATQGIGEGIARALAKEGAQVVVVGIDEPNGTRVVEEIRAQGGRSAFFAADIRQPDDCASAIASAISRFGHLDILVNNAGVFPSVSLEDTTPEIWDEVFGVNIRGAFFCCRAAIPHMLLQHGGSIINIGSTLAFRAAADRLAYAASKGALLTLTRAIAGTYARQHIRSNWITVGWVASPGEVRLREAQHTDGHGYLEQRASLSPMGRLERVEEIAAAAVYLASAEASHVTGCELNVSGGLYIQGQEAE